MAKLFEEDDPLRQGVDGERLKRAMKAAEREENRKKKSSSGGSGSGRGSNRPSGDIRSSYFQIGAPEDPEEASTTVIAVETEEESSAGSVSAAADITSPTSARRRGSDGVFLSYSPESSYPVLPCARPKAV